MSTTQKNSKLKPLIQIKKILKYTILRILIQENRKGTTK